MLRQRRHIENDEGRAIGLQIALEVIRQHSGLPVEFVDIVTTGALTWEGFKQQFIRVQEGGNENAEGTNPHN
jgi:hypothetical protein